MPTLAESLRSVAEKVFYSEPAEVMPYCWHLWGRSTDEEYTQLCKLRELQGNDPLGFHSSMPPVSPSDESFYLLFLAAAVEAGDLTTENHNV